MNIIILGVVVYLVICLIIHYNGRIVNLQTELLKKDIDILRRSVTFIEEKAKTLKRLEETKKELNEATAERYELRIKAKKLGEMANTFEKEIDIQDKEIKKLEIRNDENRKGFNEVRDELEVSTRERVRMLKKIEILDRKNKKLEGLLDKAQVAIAFSEKKFQELRTRNIDMSNTLKTYQEENAKRISRELRRKNICKRK